MAKISLGRVKGLSAYEVAVKNGYEEGEVEWIESLKGETGKTGPIGPTGNRGEIGPVGPSGAKGEKGLSTKMYTSNKNYSKANWSQISQMERALWEFDSLQTTSDDMNINDYAIILGTAEDTNEKVCLFGKVIDKDRSGAYIHSLSLFISEKGIPGPVGPAGPSVANKDTLARDFLKLDNAEIADIDATINPGVYRTSRSATGRGVFPENLDGIYRDGVLKVYQRWSDMILQEWTCLRKDKLASYIRIKEGGSWSNWIKITTTGSPRAYEERMEKLETRLRQIMLTLGLDEESEVLLDAPEEK